MPSETPALATDEDDDVVDEDEDVQDDVDESVADATNVLEGTDNEQPSGDVDEETVDLSEDDLSGGGDLFTGVDDSDNSSSGDSSESDDEDDDDGDLEDIADGLDGNAGAMEDAINDGFAQLGVFGLTDDDFEDSSLDKDGLKDEFRQTFEAFRVGYFGSQVVEEYVLNPADGDVSPAWGLAGSMLIASAMILWMRPDGDQKVQALRDAVGGIAGGAAA